MEDILAGGSAAGRVGFGEGGWGGGSRGHRGLPAECMVWMGGALLLPGPRSGKKCPRVLVAGAPQAGQEQGRSSNCAQQKLVTTDGHSPAQGNAARWRRTAAHGA